MRVIPVDRFRSKLGDRTSRGCREWATGLDRHGYGQFWFEGRNVQAHRAAFFFAYGYWPEICRHTCDNPPCCEPDHLIDGTVADNNRDAVERGRHANTKKTHCPVGHPYDEANTVVRVRAGRADSRNCAACMREQARERRGYLGNPPSAERTHCPRHHPYNEANTYVDPKGLRHCQVCRRERKQCA